MTRELGRKVVSERMKNRRKQSGCVGLDLDSEFGFSLA